MPCFQHKLRCLVNVKQMTLKYRLYQNKTQTRKWEQTLLICRGVYNSLLSNRKFQYEVTWVSIYSRAPRRAAHINQAADQKDNPEDTDKRAGGAIDKRQAHFAGE